MCYCHYESPSSVNLELMKVDPNGNSFDLHWSLVLLMHPCSLVPHTPLHNTTALLQKHYKYVGHICAMSIVQGGPGPMCVASWVYDYIAEGLDGVVINVNDVLVDSVRYFLRKVRYKPSMIQTIIIIDTGGTDY